MASQLDSLYTCKFCANAQPVHIATQRTAQTEHLLPGSSSPSLSVSFSLRCSLTHINRKMKEQERNKVLVPHALTQHLCLSWFQMNKAEYQVAHLYAMQRQIDQSITAGCSGITNALWYVYVRVCVCERRGMSFFIICCSTNASACTNIVLQCWKQPAVLDECDVFLSITADPVCFYC